MSNKTDIPVEIRNAVFSIESIELIKGDMPGGISPREYLYLLQQRYSSAFIYLYNSPFKVGKQSRLSKLTEKYFSEYSSTTWLTASLFSDFGTFSAAQKDRDKDIKSKLESSLKELEKLHERLKKHKDIVSDYKAKNKLHLKTPKKSLKTIRNTKKKINTLEKETRHLQDVLSRRVVFGGRKLAKEISKLSNFKKHYYHLYEGKSVDELQEELKSVQKTNQKKKKKFRDYRLISRLQKAIAFKEYEKESKDYLEEKKKEYNQQRLRPLNISGESVRTGNRCFDFHELYKGIVYFKFDNKIFKIKFHIDNKCHKYFLCLLSACAAGRKFPVSVKLDMRESFDIQFSYSVNELYNYFIDDKKVEKEISKLENKSVKNIYEILNNNLTEISSILKNFNKERIISVDQNPDNLGISILEKIDTENYKVIFSETIYYTDLLKKSGKSSDSEETLYLHNKLKHEIIEVAHYIETLMIHYKCGTFVCEKLNFNNNKKHSTEANRKIKNKWCRNLFITTIRKICAKNSFYFKEVYAAYSSFVGNIQYRFSDSASVATEIGRRYLFPPMSKNKDDYTYLPEFSEKDVYTVKAIFSDLKLDMDVDDSTSNGKFWIDLYNRLKALLGIIEMNRRLRQCNVTVRSRSSRFYSNKSNVRKRTFDCEEMLCFNRPVELKTVLKSIGCL